MQQAAQELEVQRDQIEAARDEAMAAVASKNITAETQSDDPFVRPDRLIGSRVFHVWGRTRFADYHAELREMKRQFAKEKLHR